MLSKREVDVNIRDNNKTNALSLAIQYEQSDIVDDLLGNDRLEVNFKEITGKFPTRKFCRHLPLLFYNLHRVGKISTTLISICVASELSDVIVIDMMNKLTESQRNAVWQIKDRQHNTLLHIAAKHKKHDLVRYLASKPLDPAQKNKSGHTALHVAVVRGDLETVKVFHQSFDHEVHINEKTGEGETAMHLAFKRGSGDIIQELVELGADLIVRDNLGNTPLHGFLQLLHLRGLNNPEDRKECFRNVWDVVVRVSVVWWCTSVLHTLIPDQDSASYQVMSRDALCCIRSEQQTTRGCLSWILQRCWNFQSWCTSCSHRDMSFFCI